MIYARIWPYCMGLYRLGNIIFVHDDFGTLVEAHNQHHAHSRFMGFIL